MAQRYFSQYAVSASFDAATFALFAVASFHMPVVDIVFTPLSDVMIVHIGKALHGGNQRAAWAAWNEAVQRLASILFPATVCAWLFGPTVLPLLFTHRYAGSVPLFMLATVEIPLWILPLDALLRAAGDTRFLFAVQRRAHRRHRRLWCSAASTASACPGAIAGGIVSETLARVGMMARGRRFLQRELGAPVRLGGPRADHGGGGGSVRASLRGARGRPAWRSSACSRPARSTAPATSA